MKTLIGHVILHRICDKKLLSVWYRMYRPKLFPSYGDVARYRERASEGGGETVGEGNEEVLENSRVVAAHQMEREAMEMAKSAKEVKKQKAFRQRADLDNRRQQFGSGNVVTFILDPQTGGKPRDIYAHEISKLLTHAGFNKEEVLGIKKNESSD